MKFTEFIGFWAVKAAEIETKGGHCFIDYQAHVRTLRIRIFSKGWQTGAYPDLILEFENWDPNPHEK